MKTLLTLLLAAIVIIPSNAQKRSVDVGSFSELSLGISATLYVKQGSDDKIEIECDDDIFEKIEFEMRGDKLVIKKEGKWNWNDGWRRSAVDIYVTMRKIEGLSVSGSGLIESDGQLDTEDIRLSVSGSGDMDLDINSDEMDLRISGSGSIRLDGEANEAEAKISGSGRVKAEDLTVKSFEASISGSGSCYITATEEVSAKISGSGSVYYAGDPKRINSNSSGSGKIRKM
ncbi:head GIN domain-containing protein [Ekhidna sp.]|uniref:head GIN domain-containing protein n=1 Tax=Ekhidna sp. TaxID=2608089 RepID=UPI003299F8D4